MHETPVPLLCQWIFVLWTSLTPDDEFIFDFKGQTDTSIDHRPSVPMTTQTCFPLNPLHSPCLSASIQLDWLQASITCSLASKASLITAKWWRLEIPLQRTPVEKKPNIRKPSNWPNDISREYHMHLLNCFPGGWGGCRKDGGLSDGASLCWMGLESERKKLSKSRHHNVTLGREDDKAKVIITLSCELTQKHQTVVSH